MRATSPSGDAEFEGVTAWSGELGYGVRPPEPDQAASDALAAEPDVFQRELADDTDGGHP
jgi:NADH-quinone oxidoreductase subunit I